MPDVWTTNPEHLREMLTAAGIRCAIKPRVITNRDPEWTCGYDSAGWIRDVYIHDVAALHTHPYYLSMLTLALGVGLFAGLLWGKWFWKSH